jgi:hypothetical protein
MAAVIRERKLLNRGDVVVVQCDHPCNIRLIDDENLPRFKSGQRYAYLGGFYKILPARIVVPKGGYWNLSVGLGDEAARANCQVNYVGVSPHTAVL